MSSAQSRGSSSRGTGNRGGRGRGGNNRGSNPGGRRGKGPAPTQSPAESTEKAQETAAVAPEPSDSGEEVCWICAEPVKYYSVSECNHRTCHVCALRLRALYKRTDCTFCKEPQTKVIFTTSPDAPYDSYGPESTPFNDSKLSIYFESREMMEETLILLRFNCPDPDCDYLGNGWADLKLHIRASHGKMLCDLCVRFKKVFAHEHALYPPGLLPLHLPSMHQRGKKDVPPEQIEGGVHPLCEFCRECFFSSDELYPHMRERHEECFICKRNEVRDQYFQDYQELEKHFESVHYACQNKECQQRKFVVFNTPLDLQGHMVEAHGSDMSARDRKQAQRVQADFTFDDVNAGRRGQGQDRSRQQPQQRREEPTRHREPQQQASTSAAPAPAARGGNARRAAFGGSLTVENSAPAAPSNRNSPAASRPATPPDRNVDPATIERHTSFIALLESLAPNPTNAVPAVKAASRGYINNETSAKDFIQTIWYVLDHNLDHTASIVNTFVDLLDDEDKKTDLLSSWRGFAIEQRRQFPDLIPSAMGSGYAGITSGRVLNAKKSTRAAARASHQSTRQVWDRVARAAGSAGPSSSSFPAIPGSSAQAALVPGSAAYAHRAPPPAASSSAFPALGGSSSSSSTPVAAPTPAYRQGPRATPWSSAASATATGGNTFRPSSAANKKARAAGGSCARPPVLSKSAFPELPASANTATARPQVSGNVSLKNILGAPAAPAVPVWSSSSGNGNGADEEPSAREALGQVNLRDAEEAEVAVGKGKKKKGKQKQTLFTLGSFPN